MKQSIINQIENGQAVLGIELGSTRIKAVLIGTDHQPIAVGGHQWENKLENGVWTYDLEDALVGVSKAYAQLNAQVKNQYGIAINKLAGIGIAVGLLVTLCVVLTFIPSLLRLLGRWAFWRDTHLGGNEYPASRG